MAMTNPTRPEDCEPDQIIAQDLKRRPGYEEVSGICGSDVTVKDIEQMVYHSHFGGRDAQIINGKWSAIRHTD